ncbi:Endo-1,4-beta-xylanase A precursor [compost metagenome]
MTFSTTHFTKYVISFVEKTFADIELLDWANKQIRVLASKGIIQGTTDDTFSPWQAVTRADFVVLLVRTLELQGTLGTPFTDVPEDSYYSDSLRIARELGITTGSGDNRFEPQAPITREDMMVLIDRALKAGNKQRSTGPLGDVLSGFTDRADISGYAVDSVAALIQLGLVHGYDQAIHPKETSNRAQTAVLMYNLYNYLYGI